MRRGLLIIVIIAVLHFGLTLAAIVTSFSLGMERFETGSPASSGERIATTIADVLLFPVAQALNVLPRDIRLALSRGPLDTLFIVMNSLGWGMGLYGAGRALWQAWRSGNAK